jgi:transcriptional regulator with XRE-family HTH domain
MNIKEALSKHGLSASALAEKINAAPPIISRLVTGERGISALNGLKIVISLYPDVSLDDLGYSELAKLINQLNQLESTHRPRTKEELIAFLKWFFEGLPQDEIAIMGQATLSMIKDILFAHGLEDRKDIGEILRVVNE